jgi:hypothetical protein
MLKGKSVATMTLAPSGAGLSGSLTAIQGIQLDNDGTVLAIEPGEGMIPILKTSLDGSVLHFTTKDEDDTVEWAVTFEGRWKCRGTGCWAGSPCDEANSGPEGPLSPDAVAGLLTVESCPSI